MWQGTSTVSNLFSMVYTTGSPDIPYFGTIECLLITLIVFLGDCKLQEDLQRPFTFSPCCVPQCLGDSRVFKHVLNA